MNKTIKDLITLVETTSLSYNEDAKAKFHRLAKKAAQIIADKLKLEASSYTIRSNKGGIAVSGEVTLHGDWLYLQFAQGSVAGSFMYRACRGQKDYTGGRNRWMKWRDLADLDKACTAFEECVIEANYLQ